VTWRWDGGWPGLAQARAAGIALGRTMGIACVAERVYVFHEGDPAVLVFHRDGRLLAAWGGLWPMAHGMTAVADGLWLTCRRTGRVQLHGWDGSLRQSLAPQPHPAYPGARGWQPSWVAQDPQRGIIWLADGYGAHLIHRYDRAGRPLGVLDGGFRSPHAVAWDPERSAFAVTDRGARRIRWFDPDGGETGTPETACHSPSSFAWVNGWLAVAELHTGIKLRDPAGTWHEVGANPVVLAKAGLPAVEQDGPRCDFPHGLAADDHGDIWFTEGVDGGRVVVLRAG
jgi:sugar lactone lactonase YvrE